MATRVFFSYSQKDEALREELAAHLDVLRANGTLEAWSARKIIPGDDWRAAVHREIDRADLVLLLVSADFLASEYCRDTEVRRAIERHKAKTARVVPVVLRPCLWEEAPFGDLEPLPRRGQPITRWPDRDEAWLEVVRGIRTIARSGHASVRGEPAGSSVAPGSISKEDATAAPAVVDAPILGTDSPAMPAALQGDAEISRGPSAPPRPEVERWLRELEAAHTEKRFAEIAKLNPALFGDDAGAPDFAKLQTRIDELKRKLREGGQLQQGDSLGDGRYYLLRLLGRGGFATVWEADDREEGKRVAIKVLHPQLANDPTRRERFFRGARAMAKIVHPGVVRVLVPYEEDAGFFYFVMELVRGGDLHRAVLAKRLDRSRVLPMTLQAGEALAAAHREGFVHRDVSPHNILIGDDGRAKLTDFDLVSAAESTGGTRTGAMGKFLYAAPEVMSRPQDADVRADVFGLGMTAIFCLYGADLPTDVLRKPEKLLAKVQCGPLAPVLLKAIEWEPQDRFASVAVFCEALRAASESLVILREPALAASVAPLTTEAPSVTSSPEDRPVSGEEGTRLTPLPQPAPELQRATFQATVRSGETTHRGAHDVALPGSLQEGVLEPMNPSATSSLGGVSEPVTKPPRARSSAALLGGAAMVLLGATAAAVHYWPADTGPGASSGAADASAPISPTTAPTTSATASGTPVAPPPSRCPSEMAYLPDGTFRMGSEVTDKDAYDDERPAHDVTLSAFCLDVAEVTVAKYRQCTKEPRNGITCPGGASILGNQFCNGDRTDRNDHPINCIDWTTADAYCKWAGGTLPTEAQWEYAARGKERRTYPWGNEPAPGPTLLNACGAECRALGTTLKPPQSWTVMYEGDDGFGATAPVKTYAKGATPEGVFDLAGNVWEWVADMSAAYSASPSKDPLQTKGTLRVLRGGGWFSIDPRWVRAAGRLGIVVGDRFNYVGFRCARGPNP